MRKRYPAAVIGILSALGIWHLAGPYVDFHKPTEPKAEEVVVVVPPAPIPGVHKKVIHDPEAVSETPAPVVPKPVVEAPKAVETPVTPLPKSIAPSTTKSAVKAKVIHKKPVVVKKKKVVRKLRKCIVKDGKLHLIR